MVFCVARGVGHPVREDLQITYMAGERKRFTQGDSGVWGPHRQGRKYRGWKASGGKWGHREKGTCILRTGMCPGS